MEIPMEQTVYDMCATEYSIQDPLPADVLKKKFTKVCSWIQRKDEKYFMLLCKDRSDYTLFNITDKNNIPNMPNDIFECLSNRGEIVGIENSGLGAWEFWIKIIDDTENGLAVLTNPKNPKERKTAAAAYCYHLFPYDIGVIEV
jgi:hypothetical protein